jgi:hypothetical protein
MIKEERSNSIGATRKGLAAKFLTLLCLVTVATVTTATATDFKALADQGYRWVRVNGPYATPNKGDAAKLADARSASSDIELQDKTHAYFLLPGIRKRYRSRPFPCPRLRDRGRPLDRNEISELSATKR